MESVEQFYKTYLERGAELNESLLEEPEKFVWRGRDEVGHCWGTRLKLAGQFDQTCRQNI